MTAERHSRTPARHDDADSREDADSRDDADYEVISGVTGPPTQRITD